jgi:hypothetical protein
MVATGGYMIGKGEYLLLVNNKLWIIISNIFKMHEKPVVDLLVKKLPTSLDPERFRVSVNACCNLLNYFNPVHTTSRPFPLLMHAVTYWTISIQFIQPHDPFRCYSKCILLPTSYCWLCKTRYFSLWIYHTCFDTTWPSEVRTTLILQRKGLEEGVLTGLVWLRIGTSGELLWMR